MFIWGVPVVLFGCNIVLNNKLKKRTIVKNEERVLEVKEPNLCQIYFNEADIARGTIPNENLDDFDRTINVMEAFMCHCKEEYYEEVLRSLILALSARNCMEGFNQLFPKAVLPGAFKEARTILDKALKDASSSNEFEKVVLEASSSLMCILESNSKSDSLRIIKNM